MANHCIDVVCISCGRVWCERGCSSGSAGPDEKFAKFLRDAIQRNPKLKDRKMSGDGWSCACGSREVYCNSVIYKASE